MQDQPALSSILLRFFFTTIFKFGIARSNQTLPLNALVAIVHGVLAVIPVFLTGEPAEDPVKHLLIDSSKLVIFAAS